MNIKICACNKLTNVTALAFVIVFYSISTISIINCVSLVQVQPDTNTAIKTSLTNNEHSVKSPPISNEADNVQAGSALDSNNIDKSKNEQSSTLTTTPTSNNKVKEFSNCTQTGANKTRCLLDELNSDESNDYVKSVYKKMTENKGMLMRTLYVSLGVTGIAVIYFVGRSVWLRRKHTKSRKYGVTTHRGNHRDMEMEPLGDGNNDDDDNDYTVFEANGRKK